MKKSFWDRSFDESGPFGKALYHLAWWVIEGLENANAFLDYWRPWERNGFRWPDNPPLGKSISQIIHEWSGAQHCEDLVTEFRLEMSYLHPYDFLQANVNDIHIRMGLGYPITGLETDKSNIMKVKL